MAVPGADCRAAMVAAPSRPTGSIYAEIYGKGLIGAVRAGGGVQLTANTSLSRVYGF